jgi:hypothetical protein
MKKVLTIVLGLVIIGLAYLLYDSIMSPVRFTKEMTHREAAVIERIKDIRTAEQAFKRAHAHYTGDFDSLINFVLQDSLEFEKTIGSKDDSVAVAKGLVKTEKFMVPVIDTIFGRKVTPQDVRNMQYIPYAPEGTKYMLAATMFQTESGVVVPVFEAKAPYSLFLADLDKQEVVNLIDERENTLNKYPGIKVGALDQATNDAGNWE